MLQCNLRKQNKQKERGGTRLITTQAPGREGFKNPKTNERVQLNERAWTLTQRAKRTDCLEQYSERMSAEGSQNS